MNLYVEKFITSIHVLQFILRIMKETGVYIDIGFPAKDELDLIETRTRMIPKFIITISLLPEQLLLVSTCIDWDLHFLHTF